MAVRVKETGAVTEPSDIQASLGISGYTDYGQLMTHANINKESKNKPMHKNVLHNLSASERKFTDADNGIYWGLKIGTVGGNWKQIHDCDYTYMRPTGDITKSPYRPSDFRGHSRDDRYTLTGSSSECERGLVMYNNPNPMGFLLNWDNYNTHYTYGVNPYECCNSGNLSGYILCVAVGNYVTALKNGRKDDGYVAIGAVGESKEFTCPALPSELRQSNGTYNVTFFLANPNDISQNIKGAWGNLNQIISGTQAITIPNAAYKNVNFMYQDITSYGTWTLGQVSQFSGTTLTIGVNMTKAPIVDTDYKIVINFFSAGSRTITFSVTANGSFMARTTFETPVNATGSYKWDATLYAVANLGDATLAESNGTLNYTAP